MTYELYLADPFGNRLALLDGVCQFSYSRVSNSYGAFSLTLPATFNQALLMDGATPRHDLLIEFWRSATEVSSPVLQMVGFARRFNFSTDQNGLLTYVVEGYDQSYLLTSRIIAYKAGSSQAKKTAAIDDMMKAIVAENLGASATDTARSLASLGLTVQANLTQGANTTFEFANRPLLDVLKELSDWSVTNPPAIYYDVEALSPTSFEFRTYKNQRGTDHAANSGNPLNLGAEFGNLTQPSLEVDYSDEVTFVYAGGPGEGADRTIVPVPDQSGRLGASPFNRREAFVDARNETTGGGPEARGKAALQAGRPRSKFAGNLVDTPGCRYGIEWGFGDKVTATYMGQQFTAMITAVTVSVDGNGKETVSARLEVTS